MKKIILGSALALGTLFTHIYSMLSVEQIKRNDRGYDIQVVSPEKMKAMRDNLANQPRTRTVSMKYFIDEEKKRAFIRKVIFLKEHYKNLFESLESAHGIMTPEKIELLNGNIEWADQEALDLLENFLGDVHTLFENKRLPLKKRSSSFGDPINEIRNILQQNYSDDQVIQLFNLIIILSDDNNYLLRLPELVNFHTIFKPFFEQD